MSMWHAGQKSPPSTGLQETALAGRGQGEADGAKSYWDVLGMEGGRTEPFPKKLEDGDAR